MISPRSRPRPSFEGSGERLYNARVKRRSFLATALGSVFAHGSHAAVPKPPPIIDSHIHLFEVSRPQGVPWPPKDSSIYRNALPERLRKLAAPLGMVGAIEIECSPWLEDNQWVLDIAARNPIIVGTIGDLEPGTPSFHQQLERFHKNPLFRGIRYGNLWGRDLSTELSKPGFIEDLKLLASAGLVLDTANPDPALIHAVVRLSDRVPNLTIIVDHLPELALPEDSMQRKACETDLHLLGDRPRVFAKVSGIVRRVGGRVPLDLGFYRDRLDRIWGTFGSDRLLYGSDWPNCNLWAQYPDVLRLAKAFIAEKDPASSDKFFWQNALRAYAWVKRDVRQP